VQPSASQERRIQPSIDPSWTPVDKRARQVVHSNRLRCYNNVASV
jgi:hypothetical protein